MALLTLDDAKGYLRVDSADEDAMMIIPALRLQRISRTARPGT